MWRTIKCVLQASSIKMFIAYFKFVAALAFFSINYITSSNSSSGIRLKRFLEEIIILLLLIDLQDASPLLTIYY